MKTETEILLNIDTMYEEGESYDLAFQEQLLKRENKIFFRVVFYYLPGKDIDIEIENYIKLESKGLIKYIFNNREELTVEKRDSKIINEILKDIKEI